MANKKISELPLATLPLSGSEESEIIQGGVNKRVAVSEYGGDPYTTPFPRVDITGTTAYTGTLSPAITAYTNGMKVHVKAKDTSTGGVTLNLNSVGVKQVWKNPTTQAGANDLLDEQGYILEYDSALNGGAGVWLMITGVSGGAGTITSVNGDSGPTVVLDATDVGADPAGSASTVNTALSNHISDATDAHAATAITNTPAGGIAATTAQAAINELDTEKAPIASPTFTGTPAAPTAAAGTNTTQLATTAFVLAAQLSSVSSSTAGGTITLDMNSLIQRMHIGSASFATPKTIAMSNVTNSLLFNFIFELTNVAAILTVPADWLMSDLAFDGTSWTPPQIGKYELGGSWDGANWFVKIQGPFS